MFTDDRIRLEPLTLEWIDALLEGDATFTERFGIEVVEGWAGFPEALPHVRDAISRAGPSSWGSHLFFADDGALVGFGGFKGPPSDGEVEVGYAIAPARQGRGLATAALRLMVEQARANGVPRVVAHTLPERNASGAVLTRCGFRQVAEVAGEPGEDVARAWRWELDLGA